MSNRRGSLAIFLACGFGFFVSDLCAKMPTIGVRIKVDSETDDHPGKAAVDGNPKTYWEAKDKYFPHELKLDLGASCNITGFVCQRRKGGTAGNIQEYEFYVTDDKKVFGKPVISGIFPTSGSTHKVTFGARKGRFVLLRALSEVDGGSSTTIGELYLLIDKVQVALSTELPVVNPASQLRKAGRVTIRKKGAIDLADAPREDGKLFVENPCGNSAEELLALARRTLKFVEKSEPQPEFAAQLAELEKDPDVEELRKLRRRILFAHPLLRFDRLLINKRPMAGPGHMCDQYLGRHSRPGIGPVILENWKSDNPKETVVLEGQMPPGCVTHPDLSFDAKRILFSFCDHRETKSQYRRFLIYEAALDGSWVRKVTGTGKDPMEGWEGRMTALIEDYDPCYLPDGGFAFITTRSQSFGRCHGSRYVPTYMLFRGELDGTGIRQLSFGEANEWDPAVLHDGRIVFTRWDYINRHDTIYQSWWSIRPDGTDTRHFYGNYTRTPCMTAEAQAIPNSHLVVGTGMAHHGRTEGSIFTVDPHLGQDGDRPLVKITREAKFPEAPDTTGGNVKFATPYALSEELYFVAKHEGKYNIYLIDIFGGRELIYSDPSIDCYAPIPIQPRPVPPALASSVAGREGMNEGVFYIQNVYDCRYPIEPGSIKRVRINKIHGQPTNSKPKLSLANNEIIKSILGTVPVDKDGSTAFRAPSGVPLQLQLLDENGMAVMTMRSLVFLQPGEMASCVGCHEQEGATPSKPLMARMKVHTPEPSAGPKYEGGFSFARTVQPVLDRYCLECHGLEEAAGGVNLIGERSGNFNKAHDALTRKSEMVKIAYRNRETGYSVPKDYFAHGGKLASYLMEEHSKYVELDRESFQRIVDWLDLNAQYHGNYSHNREENRGTVRAAEEELRAHIGQLFGSKIAKQPLAALVNVAQPDESRILKAPLARKAGGWEQIGDWESTKTPDYQKTRTLINNLLEPMKGRDIVGTCGKSNGCRCGACWVREARQAYLTGERRQFTQSGK